MRPRRGGATVEMALGVLLLVTVLTAGLHVVEMGTLAVRVPLLSASALFDTTAARAHALPGDFRPALEAIARAGPLAEEQHSRLRGATAVFTRVSEIAVRCELETLPATPVPARLSDVYREAAGAMSCHGRATFEPFRLAERFADGERGPFGELNYRYRRVTVSGPRIAMLIGDWGLAGAAESAECPLSSEGCANRAYQESVRRAYLRGGASQGRAASTMAEAVVGVSPISESRFWMSFRGEESAFVEQVVQGDDDPGRWATSQGKGSPLEAYHRSYVAREGCFLGRRCDR